MQPVDRDIDRNLIPPVEMLIDGSSSGEQFIELGERFVTGILLQRGYLAPDAAVLDVGCGNGGVARALTQTLSRAGRYEGLDIHAPSVAWLQDHYREYPNFRFTHSNVYNKMYNPQGTEQPRDYRFPFDAGEFDVVLLKSVFTHMLPDDVLAYLREVSRVLKPTGRAIITYFLLNDQSRAGIARGLDKVGLGVELPGDPLCRVADLDVPEHAVAHDEMRIRGYHGTVGLFVSEIVFGDWCGRPTPLGLQDLIVSLKA